MQEFCCKFLAIILAGIIELLFCYLVWGKIFIINQVFLLLCPNAANGCDNN